MVGMGVDLAAAKSAKANKGALKPWKLPGFGRCSPPEFKALGLKAVQRLQPSTAHRFRFPGFINPRFSGSVMVISSLQDYSGLTCPLRQDSQPKGGLQRTWNEKGKEGLKRMMKKDVKQRRGIFWHFFGGAFFLVLVPGGFVAPGGSWWLRWLLVAPVAPGGFCGFCGFYGFYGSWLLWLIYHLSINLSVKHVHQVHVVH